MKKNVKQKSTRKKIRNLSIKEFNSLFLKKEWTDFESVIDKNKFSFVKDFFEDETTQNIGRGIMTLLAVVGIITVAATMPNVFLLFKGSRRNYYKKVSKENYQNCIHSLKRRGLVNFEYNNDGTYKMTATENGEHKAREIRFEDMKIEKPDKWDKKWRLVMFDIPEKHKSEREGLRNKLIDLGFRKIQNSVFIYPYECFKEVDAVIRIYSISAYVLYFVADDFYYSENFKEYFKLV